MTADAEVRAAKQANTPDAGNMSDAEFESLVTEFWSRREPGYEDVTMIVYRAGRAVRTVYLTPPPEPAVSCCPVESPSSATAPPHASS